MSNLKFEEGSFQLPQSLAQPYRHARVIAAACAAASWARARQAAWEDEPSEIAAQAAGQRAQGAADESVSNADLDRVQAATAVAPAAGKWPSEVAPTAPIKVAGPSAITRAAARARSLGAPIARWLPRIFALAALLTAGTTARAYWLKSAATPKTGVVVLESVPVGSQVVVDGKDIGTAPATATLSAGPHVVEFRLRKATRTMKFTVASGGHTVERVDWTRKPTGVLSVRAEPSGGRVLVDGTMRGVTPLTIGDLTVGSHAVAIESAKGSIQRSVTIREGETARLDEVIFAGWLSVFSPFELEITDGTRAVRLDDRHQIMLPPGPHDLRFQNRALGFEEARRVDVRPGEVTSLSIVPPRSALSVTATAPADVWLDGVRVGQTPLVQLPVELGTREVVVRNAAGDERRFTVTIAVKPTVLNVDFTKPMPDRKETGDRRRNAR